MLQELTGKTIASVKRMRDAKYDDEGYLRVSFTDGTEIVIVASYGEYTGNSIDEYPSKIGISHKVANLIESTNQNNY